MLDDLGLDRRRAPVALLLAGILVAGAVALVGQIADFGELLEALRAADAHWFPLCAAGQVLAYGGYILAYRDVARADGGPRLGYRSVTQVVLAGFGAHALGSGPGGLAVDFWAIQRAGADAHEAARRVLAFNTLEWAVLAWLAALAAAAVLAGRGEGVPSAQALAWLAAAPVATALALATASRARAKRLSRAGAGLLARARQAFGDVVGSLVLLLHVLARPHRYPGGLAGFPLFWLGHLVTLYAALEAFSAESVVPSALVLGFATGYLVTALPLPAGGSGGIEASLAFSLHLVGIPLPAALLAVLVYRFFTFWLPLLPALAILPRIPRLRDELPKAPREGRRATS